MGAFMGLMDGSRPPAGPTVNGALSVIQNSGPTPRKIGVGLGPPWRQNWVARAQLTHGAEAKMYRGQTPMVREREPISSRLKRSLALM